jgi:hypothetical protein
MLLAAATRGLTCGEGCSNANYAGVRCMLNSHDRPHQHQQLLAPHGGCDAALTNAQGCWYLR